MFQLSTPYNALCIISHKNIITKLKKKDKNKKCFLYFYGFTSLFLSNCC